ncbi:MAG: hypothetical protein DPW14_17545 [Planctomycetes bacterium]|nr:hypothetical protein [Planctomycetota bacterium]
MNHGWQVESLGMTLGGFSRVAEEFDELRVLAARRDDHDVAQMLGEGGNLHLEWSIVARLRELTGQDFGRDRAAWSEWLKDPKPVAAR